MITITVDSVDYEVPSSALDTNWAAKQIAFEQALAAAINAVPALPDATASLRGVVSIANQVFGGFKTILVRPQAIAFQAPTAIDDPDPTVLLTVGANGSSATVRATTFEITGLSGDVLMTATPTLDTDLTQVADGQEVTLFNRDDTNNFTLQDEGTLPSSALRLTAATVGIKKGSSIRLRFFADTQLWHQVGLSTLV